MPNTPFTQPTDQIKTAAKDFSLGVTVDMQSVDVSYLLTWDVRINDSEKNVIDTVLVRGQDFPRGDGNR